MKVFISNKTIFKPTLQLLLANRSLTCDNELREVQEWDDAQFIWKNLVRGLDIDKLPNLEVLNIFMTSHQTLTEKHSLLKTGLATMDDFKSIMPETLINSFPTDNDLWIVKPVDNYGGNGIRLHRGPIKRHQIKDLSVIQRYIPNPLLLDFHKFDIRMFVLLTLDKMWFYRDGFIRIAANPYVDPSIQPGAALQLGALRTTHLTNGTQGNHVDSLDRISELGLDNTTLYQFIEQLKPIFLHAQKVENKFRRDNGVLFESFELFGLDILFDQDKRPWLLEINKDPSILRGGTQDLLADQLLEDTLKEAIWFRKDPTKKHETEFVEF
jgi:hypothetical protein